MSDYQPRWEGAPPPGSYPPRYENSRDSDLPQERRDGYMEPSRYRDDRGPSGVAPQSRHAVRVDFNDFDRGGYRSPSPPGRRSRRKSSPSPIRRSRSPGGFPYRDIDHRRVSPPNRRELEQTVARPAWDAYGVQSARGAISPNSAPKRPRSPSPTLDPRYVRRDFPATASGDSSRYPPGQPGCPDRGLSPVRTRSPIDRFIYTGKDPRDRYAPVSGNLSPPRRPLSPSRRPLSPPRRPLSPPRRPLSPPRRLESPSRRGLTPPRRHGSPPRYPPRESIPPQAQQIPMDRGLTSSSAIPREAFKTVTATVKEYINSFSGILELIQDPLDRSIPPTAFFHASATWIVTPNGNPYGVPVKYLEVLGANVSPTADGVSLEREMPIGTKVYILAKPADSPFINFIALQAWPMTTEPPPSDEMRISGVLNENKQEHYLREFHNALKEANAAHNLVQATFPIFPWQGSGPDSAATVWQIKDEEYGVLEVKGMIPEKFRFFSLFHRDHVWLKDGKRGVDVEFFKGKPLSAMVSMGQPVTLSARSIVTSSGTELKASILELQAVIVSLNIGHIPSSAPRPTMCLGGTGAYGMGSKASWYYFQQDLANTLNRQLVTYLKTYNKDYPDLHPACKLFVEPKRKSAPSAQASSVAIKPGRLPHKLTNGVAQVIEHPNGTCFIIENPERTLRCVVPASRAITSGGRHGDLDLFFPMASTVYFNAVLVDEKNPAQYVATSAWNLRDVQPSSAEVANRDRPADPESLNTYRLYNEATSAASKQSRAAAPPSAIKTSSIYYEAKEATVMRLLDENFGVLEVDNKMVLFDTCDVWLDPVTTVDKVGKKLIDVVKVGTHVYFHGALIDDSASIQYLASSVWLKKDEHLFSHKRPMSILKENIHQEKIDIYKLVVKSVGHTLMSNARSVRASSQSVKDKWDIDIKYSLTGIIKCIFYDTSYKDHQHILGGLIEITEIRALAFFLTKHSLNYASLPSIGAKLRVNLKPLKSSTRWSPDISYIAISLFVHGEAIAETANTVERKFDDAKRKLGQIMDIPAAVTALTVLKSGQIPGLIDIQSSGLAAGQLNMEQDDDDMLILDGETDGLFDTAVKSGPVHPENQELFRQIDDAIADQEPVQSTSMTLSKTIVTSASAEPKAKRPRGRDQRPEKYRALTQQGVAALDLPKLERTVTRRPFQGDETNNQNDILWRELNHKDRTAREYSEWHLHLQTPRYMPVISLQTARKMISETYKVEENHRLDVSEFLEGHTVRDSDQKIIDFVTEVRECGFMSFHTEGNGQLPSGKNCPKRSNRVFVAMSSPKTAKVLLFHCLNDVPSSLLNLLADYAIAKIQSNIATDVKILNDAGFTVRGLVDSGLLYTFLSPGTVEDGFGSKHQNEELWPGSKHYVPYEYQTFNQAYQNQKLTPRAKLHVVQNVTLPYAILFEAACRRVECDGKSEIDIFPYVNELLELTYTREPIYIRARTPKDSARDYWLPPVAGTEFDLNSKSDCSLVRRARAMYVENFDGPTLQDRKKSAEAIWRSRELPSTRHKVFRICNWSIIMAQFCYNCGDERHKTTDCPTPMVPCVIPHYPGMVWQDHSILCCPQLHSRCTICRMRGHLDQQHPLLEQTPREFREDFWRYCHMGLYTSLPYLYEINGRLRAHHWKANVMMSRMPRGLGALWLYRGPTYRFPQEYVDQVASTRQTVGENLKSNIYNYKTLLPLP